MILANAAFQDEWEDYPAGLDSISAIDGRDSALSNSNAEARIQAASATAAQKAIQSNEEFCTQASANGWLDGTTACSVMLKL